MTVVSELLAVLRADASQFTATMTRAGATSAKTTGGISKGWAVAGLIVAGAVAKSVDEFVKFQATMTRTVTLAGSTGSEMQRLSAEILSTATELGKSPTELADALYYTESAGIDTAHAMEVVSTSAKASALGLGETQVVADSLTSVLNAYGQENITAAHAADILTAAVTEGKGEADAIAGAIGRVIPVAAEMGVSFDQVAGGIAALTQTGLDANEAVTSLRGIMTSLLNPTGQAADLLESVGLSAQMVRDSIQSQGLLPTLQTLKDAFKGNDEAMGTLFGNVRAQVGALSLLGSNAKDVRGVFDRVTESAGLVDEKFKVVAETAEFKLQQAFAAVKVAMVQIGGAAAPIITALADIVKVAGPAIPLLVGLAAAIIGLKVATAATIAVQGLMTTLGGSSVIVAAVAAMRAFGAAVLLTGNLATGAAAGFRALAASIAPVVAYVAGLVAVGVAIAKINGYLNSSEQADTWAASVLSGAQSIEEMSQKVENIKGNLSWWQTALGEGAYGSSNLENAVARVNKVISDQNTELAGASGAYAMYHDILDSTVSATGESEGANQRLHASLATLVNDYVEQHGALNETYRAQLQAFVSSGDLTGAIKYMSGILGPASGATNQLAAETNELAAAQERQLAATQKLAGGYLALVANAQSVIDDQAEINRLEAAGKTGTDAYAQSVAKGLNDQLALNTSLHEYSGVMHDAQHDTDFAQGLIHKLGDQLHISDQAVRDALGPLDQYNDKLDKQSGVADAAARSSQGAASKTKDLQNNMNDARGAIEAATGKAILYASKLHNIPANVSTKITLEEQAAREQLASFIRLAEQSSIRLDVFLRHAGGPVPGHGGGSVSAAGISRYHAGGLAGMGMESNELLAVLQAGEFVMSRATVQRLGTGLLRMLNAGAASIAPAANGPSAPMGGPDSSFRNVKQMLGNAQGLLGIEWRDANRSLNHLRNLRDKAQSAAQGNDKGKLDRAYDRAQQAVRDAVSYRDRLADPKKWSAAFRRELLTPGTSDRQRMLLNQLIRTARITTTPQEARDLRGEMKRAIRQFDDQNWDFTKAGGGLKIVVRPDRRRFTRDLEYDSLTNGM